MQQSYVDILKKQLQQRIYMNPRYSLRSFARNLDLDPGFLSHILNKKRKLSVSRAMDVLPQLKLTTQDKKLFISLVRLEAARTVNQKNEILADILKNSSVLEIKKMDLQAFAAISNWYHHAIIELTFKEKFIVNPKSVSKILGITEIEATLAIDRLVQLKLLQVQNKKYVKVDGHLNPPSDISDQALKNRHKQILKFAEAALIQQPVNQREFQSVTMCIDESLLPEAKKRIQEFAWDLCNQLESKKRKKIYELSIQLFSLETDGKK